MENTKINEKEMINKINIFFVKNNIQYKLNDIDIISIKKILSKVDFNANKIKKQTQRKLHIILNKKKKFKKILLNENQNKYLFYIIFINIYKKEKIFPFIKHMFIINLISFHSICIFFDFFLYLNKENRNNILLYIKNIIYALISMKKIIKELNKKEINDIIKKDVNNDLKIFLKNIFDCINNNENENLINIIIRKNIIKYPKILSLIKLCCDYYKNNIINEDNKTYIINNLKILLTKNFNNEHSNYLLYITNKYISNLNFHNKNSEKNYFSFINKILEFFSEIDYNYSINKYFIFDSSKDKNGILITSPIKFMDKYDSNLNFSIIFSFKPIDIKKNTNSVIFSMNDFSTKKTILSFVLKQNQLYLYLYEKNNKKEILLSENILNNINYLCYLYLEEKENFFYFFINDNHKILPYSIKFISKKIADIYIELGNNMNTNNKFNGIIGPLLLFKDELKDAFEIFQNIKDKLKEKYYLIGKIYNNKDKDNDNIILFDYDEYYGINNNNELIILVKEIQDKLGNLILYLNPEVIYNNLKFYNNNKFRDFQQYHPNNKIYYEIKNIQNINDIIYIEIPFLHFFINNKLFDYIILNIELIYNELLISEVSEEKYELL